MRSAVALLLLVGCSWAAAAEPAPDFEREVAPILESRCLSCHDRAHAKGDLVLETREAALKSEGVLVPGQPEESVLIDMISGDKPEMPPKGGPLSKDQVATLRRWVAAGAPWPAERTLVDRPIIKKDWWSLRPLAAQTPPAGVADHPIDAYVLQKLREQKLEPAPLADLPTLLRRVSFDLTGLPPTPAEIESVTSAARSSSESQAYEDYVDRLLASPRYGEHWARHWLDVARFSESQGYERDKMRPHAWRYRDYVIDSLNADKPYDQFMREQIAGDIIEPVTHEGIIATGFLVAGPWDEVGATQKSNVMRSRVREEELEDIVSAVGQTFLGVTINCARCHAHKFDPIPQEDYYNLKAVFEGVKHGDRPVLTATELTAWKAEHPEWKPGGKEPQPQLVYAANPEQPRVAHVLSRGDILSPKEPAIPRGLSAIASPQSDLGLKADSPEAERRRRFASWLSDPANPLPARVIVNRLWQYHLGRGLVDTPSDLGSSGNPPSHPELLDYLAGDLIGHGWSLKRLHRLIVTSAAFRRSSQFDATCAARDAENRMLWRFSPRRLAAEEVRDTMLLVSGELNDQRGGPGYQTFDLVIKNSHFYTFKDKLGAEFNRRTIYRMGIQSLRTALLDSLDCPDLATKTPVRGETTTPIQALTLMNDSFIQRQAAALAARAKKQAEDSIPQQVQAVYMLALGREATSAELSQAESLVRTSDLATLCWAIFNSSEFVYLR